MIRKAPLAISNPQKTFYCRGLSSYDGRRTKRNYKRLTNESYKVQNKVSQTEYLYGSHCILQALQLQTRNIHRILIQEGKVIPPAVRKAIQEIESKTKQSLSCRTLSKDELYKYSNDNVHQGIILEVDPLELEVMHPGKPSVIQKQSNRPPIILALNQIHDPQNYGSILRTALYLGCDAIVATTKNSASISAAVSRASSGACELLAKQNKLFITDKMPRLLRGLGEVGWKVVGTSCHDKSIQCSSLRLEEPTVVVMGNEANGLGVTALKECDSLVQIPGCNEINSLNVGVATGILLYQLTSSSQV